MIFPRRRSRLRRVILWLAGLSCLLAVAGVAGLGVALQEAGRTPREWAPYLQKRAMRHSAIIVETVDLVAGWLIWADRLVPSETVALPASLGASVARSGAVAAGGRLRPVGSLDALRDAVVSAQPGDVIELLPGHYHFDGSAMVFSSAGTAAAPITLRAARLGDAVIESGAIEAFKVIGAFWRFENLVMRGVCDNHTYCEHAIHIAGAATDVVVRNNRIEDFNAHIKINGESGRWPDRGVIEGNTLVDTVPRVTDNPVTPIDLVGASFWRVSGNIIADFVRGSDGAATYGAYFKGAGEGNVLERNLVVCEWKLRQMAGQHVGLSLGGGGTGPDMRRDLGHTGIEEFGGVIRDNLIAFCSDDGIYLNRAARSVIDRNTLLDTAGIDSRFIESSAVVTGNIVDGKIDGRDGGGLHGWENTGPILLQLFAGWHPQRGFYQDPVRLDLRWRKEPVPLSAGEQRVDLCGVRRAAASHAGAFEDFAACQQSGQ